MKSWRRATLLKRWERPIAFHADSIPFRSVIRVEGRPRKAVLSCLDVHESLPRVDRGKLRAAPHTWQFLPRERLLDRLLQSAI